VTAGEGAVISGSVAKSADPDMSRVWQIGLAGGVGIGIWSPAVVGGFEVGRQKSYVTHFWTWE
jgi:hypothetical protein